MKKIDKEFELETFSVEDFDGNLGDIITKLQNLVSKYNDYHSLRICAGQTWDTVDISLRGSRKETDAEFAARLKLMRKNKAAAEKKKKTVEKQELALLKKLKEKYEKSN